MKHVCLAIALLLGACGSPVAHTPPAAPAATTESTPLPTANTNTTTVAPAPNLPPDFCGSSFCGCWTARTLHFRVRLQDAQGAPAGGVSAICHNETQPAAQSAGDGALAIDADTLFSPGRGYQRCGAITLSDPQHRFVDTQVSSRAILPNNTITLQPAR